MKLVRIALIPLALLAIAFVRLVRPIVLIRFGEICGCRVGHLAANMELYLCEREKDTRRIIDIFCKVGRTSNKQLLRMLGRSVFIDPTGFVSLLLTVDRRFRGWEEHAIETVQYDRDIRNLYEKSDPHIGFTAAEIERGIVERRAMGIPDGAKWVCLIARDGRYLSVYGGKATYHDYRDSDIKNYRQAALALAERGYYVLRMGELVNDKFGVDHPHVIDYATNGMRSDFMDVYLGAFCAFCLTNGTGYDAIPTIFRRPICYVNIAPIEYLMTWMPGIAIWKHHVRAGLRMSPREIVMAYAGQALATEIYSDFGIRLEENTPQEIEDAAIEMANVIAGYYAEQGAAAMQQRFWDAFPRSMSPYNGRPLHGKIRLRIGTKFLRQYDHKLAVAA